MARTEILAGRNLLTERPIIDQRFSNLSLTTEFGSEVQLVGITYDTRHLSPQGNPLLWLAGDTNKKLYVCDSKTLDVVVSFDYPEARGTVISPTPPVKNCFGLATLNEPTDCIIGFLSEKQIEGNPILYHLRYNPSGGTPSQQLVIENWFIVNSAAGGAAFDFDIAHRGMSEYHNDFMVVAKWNNINTIGIISKEGLPLAVHPSFTVADQLCSVQHINQRVYVTIDMTATADVGSRVLAKFLTEEIDKERMIPLMSIEPFFLSGYNGDITIFQDRMASCYADNVYTYRMCYFMFIVDDYPNDDIDMGSILIGDYKVKRVKIKNIADIYRLKDITISKDSASITCPNGDANCPALEAVAWVRFSVVDPAINPSDMSVWLQTVSIATAIPYVEPDGEREFWIRVDIPENYTSLTVGGNPRPVTVDDGPFIVPLIVRAKVG